MSIDLKKSGLTNMTTPQNELSLFISTDILHANRLRRALMTSICKLGIFQIHFIKNDSRIFPQDYLAQRLSLLSIRARRKFKKCNEKLKNYMTLGPLDTGNESYGDYGMIELKVQNKGPMRMIRAGELKCDDSCEVVFPTQPIMILGPGECINLKAYYIWGCADSGIQFQAMTTVMFDEEQLVEFIRPILLKDKYIEDAFFEYNSKGILVRTTKPFYGAVPLKWEEHIISVSSGRIRFTLETDGSISPLEALAQVGHTVPKKICAR